MGVTLWLVPPQRDAERLRRIMRIRPSSKPLTIDASYPDFDPHITLLALPPDSEITLDALRDAIPSDQKSLSIGFKAVETSDHFFRSALITIIPTAELFALHEHVHASLKLDPRTPMFPHVSLCYITDEDAQCGERDKYLHELETQGRIKREVGSPRVSLDCGEEDDQDWMDGFSACEVWVAECNGPVASWKILDKIPLA
ncbi:hypothetical protein CCMSSC00406_0005140 [Pleurotus cornucopiae]|uniref:Uncharacterized protein n=1 Tax=Pleurotus cornucopiae TaxID=5321 RepID=A0ACB7J6K8_PLECO|nr:hypothetical protein CCMSSC00406_0005140 [Pleurotus cornucopiae]